MDLFFLILSSPIIEQTRHSQGRKGAKWRIILLKDEREALGTWLSDLTDAQGKGDLNENDDRFCMYCNGVRCEKTSRF